MKIVSFHLKAELLPVKERPFAESDGGGKEIGTLRRGDKV